MLSSSILRKFSKCMFMSSIWENSQNICLADVFEKILKNLCLTQLFEKIPKYMLSSSWSIWENSQNICLA
jgi:hypothetical protein